MNMTKEEDAQVSKIVKKVTIYTYLLDNVYIMLVFALSEKGICLELGYHDGSLRDPTS